MDSSRRSGRSLQYESLEPREMMAVTGTLKNGVLKIVGTNGADTVNFKQTAGVITASGIAGSWSADQVNSIVIDLKKGNDVLSFDSLANGGTQIFAENITVTSAKKQNDFVHLANGHDVSLTGLSKHTLFVTSTGTAVLNGQELSWNIPSPPAPATATISSLWPSTATPGTADSNDTGSVELGVKFTSDVSGYITGVRFYKAAGNTGTHIAHLWTSTGQLLATATFTSESASGWQQVNFATPVAVTAGATYVASYFAPRGHFSVNRNYFASPLNSGLLHVAPGGGVYQYGASSAFPGQTYQNSNYWVDVVLSSAPPADTTPPTVTSTSPGAGAINVATSASIAIFFSEAMDAATISNSTVQLLDGSSIITATVVFNSNNNSVTITPTAPLSNSKTYTISVAGGSSGVKDLAGNALAQNFSSTFTTVAPDTTPPTVNSINPASGSTNVATSAAITISFSEALNASTVNATTIALLNGSAPLAATVTYNASANTATITPNAALSNSTTYTVSVLGGASGVKDAAGNALAQSFSSTFTTAAPTTVSSLWPNTATPGTADSNDASSVELGVKFTSDVSGYITGVRFYKAAGNTGTHIAHLWTSTGQLLATATFVSESASGWQQVNFATPVAVTAGTTYVASYFAPKGHFSVDRNYFATPLNSGLLHVTPGGGVYQYGTSSAFPGQSYQNSNYWVDVVLSSTSSPTPPTPPTPPAPTNWFDSHVIDAALRSLGHSLYTDGLIDRNDMISLLRNAEDGSVIDSTELTDLRTIASSTTLFGSVDYVYKLASYAVTANTANAKYQGVAMGNLAAGSSSAQMEKLISKWFLGADHPTADGAYRQVAGQLFAGGATYTDIHQGSLGDCYFVSSLGEVALKNQAAITNMFVVNGDGTYTVRFYQNGVAQYVTVDSYLPTTSGGALLYANRGAMYNNAGNELWTALAEKAYVQLNEMGWTRGYLTGSGQNSYAAIEGGYIYAALGHISGQTTSPFTYTTVTTSFQTFVDAYNQGKMIGFASKSTPASTQVVGDHAYAVVGYNAANQTVTLFNPWGIEYGLVTMTWAQIQGSFQYFDRTV